MDGALRASRFANLPACQWPAVASHDSQGASTRTVAALQQCRYQEAEWLVDSHEACNQYSRSVARLGEGAGVTPVDPPAGNVLGSAAFHPLADSGGGSGQLVRWGQGGAV